MIQYVQVVTGNGTRPRFVKRERPQVQTFFHVVILQQLPHLSFFVQEPGEVMKCVSETSLPPSSRLWMWRISSVSEQQQPRLLLVPVAAHEQRLGAVRREDKGRHTDSGRSAQGQQPHLSCQCLCGEPHVLALVACLCLCGQPHVLGSGRLALPLWSPACARLWSTRPARPVPQPTCGPPKQPARLRPKRSCAEPTATASAPGNPQRAPQTPCAREPSGDGRGEIAGGLWGHRKRAEADAPTCE